MHSEMVRTGTAASRTATGREPFSTMTFAPASTDAISAAKVARRFRFGDVNHILSRGTIIPRRTLDIGKIIGNNVPDEFVFHAAGGKETRFERCSFEQVCGCGEGSWA